MAHLVLFGRFREEEGAPICYATNYATLGEYKIACCAGDSRGGRYISNACLAVGAVSIARSRRTLLLRWYCVVGLPEPGEL